MTKISLIAAIDENRGLGKNNQLLCHLPADLAHFKQLTIGKPIIMGRRTFDSIGKPLPGRTNIVLSHKQLSIEGVKVVPSLKAGIDEVCDAAEIMVIGGSAVFEEALPLAQRIYLTIIHHQFDADVFFPKFDETQWVRTVIDSKMPDAKNVYRMTFCQFDRL